MEEQSSLLDPVEVDDAIAVPSETMLFVCSVDTNKARDLVNALNGVPEEIDQEQQERERQLEAESLVHEIYELDQHLEKQRARLKEVQAVWNERDRELLEDIQVRTDEVELKEADLDRRVHPPEEEIPPPPGPECLLFVEGSMFMLVATTVIIVNIVVMIMQLLHPSYKEKFLVLDQFFMIFYVVELALKAILWRRKLLVGKVSDVWWNWLDLIIVVSGVMDMWLKPIAEWAGLLHSSQGGIGSNVVGFLRMLRLARLARILKLVRVFLLSDLSWVSGTQFQGFMMGVIAFNCVLMGFESDIEFVGWAYMEEILLVIFSFELAVRLKYFGCKFFCEVWNWLDFVIVIGGVVDQWMFPAISIIQRLLGKESHHSGNVAQFMTLLRMARLLRILRLVRLIKNIDPLVTLIVGIVKAMQGMIWVLLLTAVLLYAAALMSVRILNGGLLFKGDPPQEVVQTFPSVTDGIYVLFLVMNGENEIVQPMLPAVPGSKWIFAFFTVISTWSILSVLTSVVTDNMVRATEEHEEDKENAYEAVRATRSRVKLAEIFKKVDANGTGTISETEFEALLHDGNKVIELLDATGIPKSDIQDLFEVLSSIPEGSKDPVIARNDFLEGLTEDMSKPVTERTVIRLEKRLATMEKRLLCLERLGHDRLKAILPSSNNQKR